LIPIVFCGVVRAVPEAVEAGRDELQHLEAGGFTRPAWEFRCMKLISIMIE